MTPSTPMMPSTRADTRRRQIMKILVYVLFVFGFALMCLNLYGLTQSVRRPGLGVDDHALLRFIPEEVWSYEQSMQAVAGLKQLPHEKLVPEAVSVVKQSLVHPEWFEVDPVEYRQLVPPWENYFLYLLGRFSGLPQFERYHYSDYRRSIRRGIGVCGDASIALSSILDEHGIDNDIVLFYGHVIVEYQTPDGSRRLADPDFGVMLRADLKELTENPAIIAADYLNAGYSRREVNSLLRSYATDYTIYDDTYNFMAKRYVFERVSYAAKWVLPILLMLPLLIGAWRRKRTIAGADHDV